MITYILPGGLGPRHKRKEMKNNTEQSPDWTDKPGKGTWGRPKITSQKGAYISFGKDRSFVGGNQDHFLTEIRVEGIAETLSSYIETK